MKNLPTKVLAAVCVAVLVATLVMLPGVRENKKIAERYREFCELTRLTVFDINVTLRSGASKRMRDLESQVLSSNELQREVMYCSDDAPDYALFNRIDMCEIADNYECLIDASGELLKKFQPY